MLVGRYEQPDGSGKPTSGGHFTVSLGDSGTTFSRRKADCPWMSSSITQARSEDANPEEHHAPRSVSQRDQEIDAHGDAG